MSRSSRGPRHQRPTGMVQGTVIGPGAGFLHPGSPRFRPRSPQSVRLPRRGCFPDRPPRPTGVCEPALPVRTISTGSNRAATPLPGRSHERHDAAPRYGRPDADPMLSRCLFPGVTPHSPAGDKVCALLPHRGRGTTRRVVEGHPRSPRGRVSTQVPLHPRYAAVPLPVSGRIR